MIGRFSMPHDSYLAADWSVYKWAWFSCLTECFPEVVVKVLVVMRCAMKEIRFRVLKEKNNISIK